MKIVPTQVLVPLLHVLPTPFFQCGAAAPSSQFLCIYHLMVFHFYHYLFYSIILFVSSLRPVFFNFICLLSPTRLRVVFSEDSLEYSLIRNNEGDLPILISCNADVYCVCCSEILDSDFVNGDF